MEDIKDLLKELIEEVRGLTTEIVSARDQASADAEALLQALNDLGTTITGPTAYNLEDLHKELSEIHTEVAVAAAGL